MSIATASTAPPDAVLSPPTPPQRLLVIDASSFQESFDRRPFVIRHRLTDHPLFSLPRLIELGQQLPKSSVEYNGGDLAVNQDPSLTPQNGLTVEETIRRIEDCRSWMVLKNVETDAEYRELLHSCLADVEGFPHPANQGICHREGFIFISSPGSVTPYHMDPECNFLLQVRGQKQVSMWDRDDRTILTEQELELFYTGVHRNMVFKDEYQSKASVHELRPGEGLHFPVTAPHWVKNGNAVSISFSITFQTRATERRAALYNVNHYLRSKGIHPTPVGQCSWRDALKYNSYRVLRRTRRLLGMGTSQAASGY